MGYIANVPLRFGHTMIQPGEDVPVEPGRNYASMIRLGQITVVPESPARQSSSGRGRQARGQNAAGQE